MAARQRNRNEIFSTKSTVRMFHSIKKMTIMTGSRAKKKLARLNLK